MVAAGMEVLENHDKESSVRRRSRAKSMRLQGLDMDGISAETLAEVEAEISSLLAKK